MKLNVKKHTPTNPPPPFTPSNNKQSAHPPPPPQKKKNTDKHNAHQQNSTKGEVGTRCSLPATATEATSTDVCGSERGYNIHVAIKLLFIYSNTV